MGLFDKAKDLVSDNEDAIKDGIDKAADLVEDKVGDEHADKVEKGAEALKGALDKLPE